MDDENDVKLRECLVRGDMASAKLLSEGVGSMALNDLLWERALACDQKSVEHLLSCGADWQYDTFDFSGAEVPPESWTIGNSDRGWHLPLGESDRRKAQFFADHGAPYDRLLRRAVELDDSAVVEFVCSLGVSGDEALRDTALFGSMESASLLLKSGADPNARNAKGQTALHVCAEPLGAATWGRDFCGDGIALALLEHGADISANDNSGMTPLHAVAFDKYSRRHISDFDVDTDPEEMARLALVLITAGADINCNSAVGASTPLHVAAATGNLAIATVLVEAGADLGALDENGRTPEQIAIENNHTEVATYLAAHGTKLLPHTPPSSIPIR